MLIKTFGAALNGVDAFLITVETACEPGVNFMMVGLPDSSVKESQQRIEAAFESMGFRWPGRKIVVNMAPADIRKEGAAYDLPIALSILAASEQVFLNDLDQTLFMGELALDGGLRPIRGALSMAVEAKRQGVKRFFLPQANAEEAAVVSNLEVYAVSSLNEVLAICGGQSKTQPMPQGTFNQDSDSSDVCDDFFDVKGQVNIKRALEIAAAGGHNVLLLGPPGSGKSMLAKRLPSILPPLSLEEAIETTKIHSVAGHLSPGEGLLKRRPFRAPHHTISDVALVGGGPQPKPGEISLAHHGVLFLDELPEFKRQALEVLRQPMEEHNVCISRSKMRVTFPAGFMLVAAMNPCPCGNYNHPHKACVCAPGQVGKYLNRISGPLLDRIDLHVQVVPVEITDLEKAPCGERSADIRQRVVEARQIQAQRYADSPQIHCNAHMTRSLTQAHCRLDGPSQERLRSAMERFDLSARSFDRILRVARTIADLEHMPDITSKHIAEAIHFRTLDRGSWGK